MPSRALLLCSIAGVLGTLAVSPVTLDVHVIAAGGIIVLATAAALRAPLAALALCAVVLATALNAELHQQGERVIEQTRTARYRAVVLEVVAALDGSSAVTLKLQNRLRLLAQLREPVQVGTMVLVRGRLEPFDEARNPGESSQREIESERGLDGRLEQAEILSTNPQRVQDWQLWLVRAHAWAHAQLRDRVGEPSASIVAGELWGDRSSLPPALRAEFQETGTVHVLITAGLHLGAVAALALGLFTLLTLPRWGACLATIAVVWFFVWWSGAQLPAVRAATMATAALLARACGRATFSWNSLALAAMIVTISRPTSVPTASFALSFSCVGAIFTCAAPLRRWIEVRVALPEYVLEAIVLSIATQVGVWPLIAATFLQFMPYAVLANLAVVPCVAATMALGAAQLALAWCAPLAQACANCNSWLLTWMLSAVQTIAALPCAAIAMSPPPPWSIAGYDAAIAAAPLLWRRGAPTLAVAAMMLATVFVLWPPRPMNQHLRITVLDVGQADAIVVQTPRGHTLLVDAGGRLERGAQSGGSIAEAIGERIVVPFLLRQGVHAIDAVIVSHPHGDHVGGVAPALRRLRVAEIADSGQRYGGNAYRDAITTARSQAVPVLYPRARTQWRTDDGVQLRFLGPSLPFISNSRNDINENSIAFTLRFKSFCMFFTGDAGAAAEARFLAENVDLQCEILKVGHHGSAYGSTPPFIAAVHPRYAIISVGRHNMFGHPAQSTLETLQRCGAIIYRTDRNGAVTIESNGNAESVKTMLSD